MPSYGALYHSPGRNPKAGRGTAPVAGSLPLAVNLRTGRGFRHLLRFLLYTGLMRGFTAVLWPHGGPVVHMKIKTYLFQKREGNHYEEYQELRNRDREAGLRCPFLFRPGILFGRLTCTVLVFHAVLLFLFVCKKGCNSKELILLWRRRFYSLSSFSSLLMSFAWMYVNSVPTVALSKGARYRCRK